MHCDHVSCGGVCRRFGSPSTERPHLRLGSPGYSHPALHSPRASPYGAQDRALSPGRQYTLNAPYASHFHCDDYTQTPDGDLRRHRASGNGGGWGSPTSPHSPAGGSPGYESSPHHYDDRRDDRERSRRGGDYDREPPHKGGRGGGEEWEDTPPRNLNISFDERPPGPPQGTGSSPREDNRRRESGSSFDHRRDTGNGYGNGNGHGQGYGSQSPTPRTGGYGYGQATPGTDYDRLGSPYVKCEHVSCARAPCRRYPHSTPPRFRHPSPFGGSPSASYGGYDNSRTHDEAAGGPLGRNFADSVDYSRPTRYDRGNW